MANKKKKSKEPNPKILNKQDRIKSTKKLDQLDQGTAYIPNEAIINVPISGSFRYAIEEESETGPICVLNIRLNCLVFVQSPTSFV